MLPVKYYCVQVYKGFLVELHFHGILTIADIDKIFANLSELCEVRISMSVCVVLITRASDNYYVVSTIVYIIFF